MSQITTPAQLMAAYPYQFAKPMDPWAFSFARGWMPIIVRACDEIDAVVRVDKYHHRFHWDQIKEKFGTLRMYWQARGMGEMPRDLVSPAGVLPLIAAAEGKERDGLVATQIASIVLTARAQSAQTCIVCGSAGSLREAAWTLTLCDKHARQSEEGERLEISW